MCYGNQVKTADAAKKGDEPAYSGNSARQCGKETGHQRCALLPGATGNSERPGDKLADKTFDEEHVQHGMDTVEIGLLPSVQAGFAGGSGSMVSQRNSSQSKHPSVIAVRNRFVAL